jgi:hypothetical protein
MENIKDDLKSGKLVPFLGMGVFKSTKAKDGSTLPYDSDSMILALNSGRAMSPRLMYEYSRAAMSIEQRRGRDYIVQMTNHIYSSKEYELPFVYQFFKEIKPKYIIDTNLDDSLLKIYSDCEHFLITGVSRITAEKDRFIVYRFDIDKKEYIETTQDSFNNSIPILFKPMGCMKPNMDFIVSDADFVDWLTEAMGGYAVPKILKEYRKDKSYLFLGVDFGRDTFRMVANELTIDLDGGYMVSDKSEFTKKESKFISKHNLGIIPSGIDEFIKSL